MATNLTQRTYGTVWFSANSVFYEPNANCVPGSQTVPYTFQYTMVDGHGGSSTAEVSITMVDVTGYTLEWQQPDGGWVVVPPGEVSWSHDTLRWTPHFAPFDPPDPYLVDWKAIAWPNRNQPVEQWSTFASGDPFLPAEGNPGANDWAITPLVHFYYYDEQAQQMSQTGFAVAIAAPPEKIIAEITSIQWVEHTDPALAGQLVPDDFGHRLYPDAEAPGGPARRKVDVLVQVAPARAGIPVRMRVRDVDDPTDSDGPIDTDPTPKGKNPPDNLGILAFSNFYPTTTDSLGQVRGICTANSIQPGDNWRIAAAGRDSELNVVKALAPDDASRLFHDTDNDDVYDVGQESTIDEWASVAGIRATPRLTIWRRLHIEADSMGAVVDNFVDTQSGQVYPGQPGMFVVPLMSQVEAGRFEHGTLWDGGNFFDIESNTATEVTVLVGACQPQSNVAVRLWDDDQQTMPEMPDLGLMEEAYGAAFITPILDGGGDPQYNKTTVPFQPNVGSANAALFAQIGADNGLESHGNRSPAFWIAYVQAAYQSNTQNDNDPDSETGTWGGTPSSAPKKGSLLFLETAKDIASPHEYNFTPEQTTLYLQRHVVHETAHQFGVEDHQGPAPSVMHYASVDDISLPEGSRFNESQKLMLRTREQSPGA